MELRIVCQNEAVIAIEIIDMAKAHLREQGIDQWQNGYPDIAIIHRDIEHGKGYFVVNDNEILGYLCIDYDGEPAYDTLRGEWHSNEPYVVVHRMAFHDNARGKGVSDIVFSMVEDLSRKKGINNFRVDTDADNHKMQHILQKNGFTHCGTIWFDNSEKIAFDKLL